MKVAETNAIALGGMLGFLNTLLIAIGMGLYASDETVGLLVFMLGIIPGMVTGFLLGAITRWAEGSSVWMRRVIIGVPAIVALLALVELFAVSELFGLASIPTLVCVLILERKTRPLVVMPVATARF